MRGNPGVRFHERHFHQVGDSPSADAPSPDLSIVFTESFFSSGCSLRTHCEKKKRSLYDEAGVCKFPERFHLLVYFLAAHWYGVVVDVVQKTAVFYDGMLKVRVL